MEKKPFIYNQKYFRTHSEARQNPYFKPKVFKERKKREKLPDIRKKMADKKFTANTSMYAGSMALPAGQTTFISKNQIRALCVAAGFEGGASKRGVQMLSALEDLEIHGIMAFLQNIRTAEPNSKVFGDHPIHEKMVREYVPVEFLDDAMPNATGQQIIEHRRKEAKERYQKNKASITAGMEAHRQTKLTIFDYTIKLNKYFKDLMKHENPHLSNKKITVLLEGLYIQGGEKNDLDYWVNLLPLFRTKYNIAPKRILYFNSKRFKPEATIAHYMDTACCYAILSNRDRINVILGISNNHNYREVLQTYIDNVNAYNAMGNTITGESLIKKSVSAILAIVRSSGDEVIKGIIANVTPYQIIQRLGSEYESMPAGFWNEVNTRYNLAIQAYNKKMRS